MNTTLEESNAALRAVVQARLDATPSDNYSEWEPGFQPKGPSAAEVIERFGNADTLAVATLRQAIDAVNDRHQKYGPPTQHFARTAALVNAAFGTTFSAADWALVMVLDKVARQRGPCATDDAAVDIAGYAACHQECRRSQ